MCSNFRLKVDIPVDELKELPHGEAFTRMLFYWENLTSNVKKKRLCFDACMMNVGRALNC